MSDVVNDYDSKEVLGTYNLEIEQLVLATFINYSDTYYMYSDKISKNDFTNDYHRYIYNAIKQISKDSLIDIATVSDKLIQLKYVELIYDKHGTNLIDYVTAICDAVDTDTHLKDHIKILNNYTVKRGLLEISESIRLDCENNISNDIIVDKINNEIITLLQSKNTDFSVEKSFDMMFEDLNQEQQSGIKTGIKLLDDRIYQFDYGSLIIVAGAASMGKTAFALEIFKNNIFMNNNPVIFSLEMTDLELTKRMVSVEACIELRKLRDKNLDQSDWKDIKSVRKHFQDYNYQIDDKSRKLYHIINNIRKYVIRYNSKLIVIDYLQLITCNVKSGVREQEIATISRALKEVASELKIVVIALSQLNRQVSQRSNKRPMLSDLRESGAIEQDADAVIFPYRAHYYDNDKNKIPPVEDVEIIIAKGRNIGLHTVDIKYCGRYVKFFNQDEIEKYPKIQYLQHKHIVSEGERLKSEVSPNSDQSVLDVGQDQPF